MTEHVYKFVQTVSTDRGTKWGLRRDDGKRVKVSRVRFNELHNQGRIVENFPAHQETR